MMVLAGGAVQGLPAGFAVAIAGDRISAVGPTERFDGERIDTTGATVVAARVELALDLDLPDEPGAAALAAIGQLRQLRREGLGGARVHGSAAALAPVIAAQDRFLLPRLRLAGPTLRFIGARVEVLGLGQDVRTLSLGDPLLGLLARLPRLEAIEGDPPPGFAAEGIPRVRDVVDGAAFCGFTDVGGIAPGCRADLTVVDADGRVRLRLIAGRIAA